MTNLTSQQNSLAMARSFLAYVEQVVVPTLRHDG
jgi:hypothetical protein